MHSFSSSPSAIIVIFHHLQHGWSHSRTGLAGSRSASYLSIPVWFAIPIRGGPTMAPAAVTRCFRRNALQGGVSERRASRRRQPSLPASKRRTKSRFSARSAGFLFVSCLGCPEARQRHNIAALVFRAPISGCPGPLKHSFVSVCCSSLFSLFIMVLLPRAFMFSYNAPPPRSFPPPRPPSSIILPFLPMNQTLWIPHALLQAK